MRGFLVLASIALGTSASCAKESPPGDYVGESTGPKTAPGTVASVKGTPRAEGSVVAFTNEEAVGYLKGSCGGCHEKGQSYQSFWSFEKDKLTADSFTNDNLAHRVYQDIRSAR